MEMEMTRIKNFIMLTMLAFCFLQEARCTSPEGNENESNFLEYYSQNKAFLDPEAPYGSNLENFAEYHDALLKVIDKFEKSRSYEDEFPIEGKTTNLRKELYIVKYFNFLINEVTAKNYEAICFYGGWPSRILNGKCQSPWKNSDDSELKKLGNTYDSSHFCGGRNLFRCNPLLFGPGEDSKGICVKFENAADISTICYDKSADQIEKIYKSFKENPEFRKNYLATVAAMKNFCTAWNSYPACRLLTLQEKEIATYNCSQLEKGDQLYSKAPITSLTKAVEKVTTKISKQDPPVALKHRTIAQERPDPAPLTKLDVQACTHFKDFLKQGVPEIALKQALTYYNKNKSLFTNDHYISIADYSQNSVNKRFYLLDLSTGTVNRQKVSHGSGSVNGVSYGDEDHNGMLNRCSQNNGSKQNITK